MEVLNKKKFFVDCLRILHKKLNHQEYKKVVAVMEGLYQGETFGYDSGFDPAFYADLHDKNAHVKYDNIIPLVRK